MQETSYGEQRTRSFVHTYLEKRKEIQVRPYHHTRTFNEEARGGRKGILIFYYYNVTQYFFACYIVQSWLAFPHHIMIAAI